MKNIVFILMFAGSFHISSLADFILRGEVAKSLYELLPASPVVASIEASTIKPLGPGFSCARVAILDPFSSKESYRYICLLPNLSEGSKIHLPQKPSQILYFSLEQKNTKQQIKTLRNGVTTTRTLDFFSCSEDTIVKNGQESIAYRCTIQVDT